MQVGEFGPELLIVEDRPEAKLHKNSTHGLSVFDGRFRFEAFFVLRGVVIVRGWPLVCHHPLVAVVAHAQQASLMQQPAVRCVKKGIAFHGAGSFHQESRSQGTFQKAGNIWNTKLELDFRFCHA